MPLVPPRRRSALVLALAAASGLSAGSSTAYASLASARSADPVVLTGARVPRLAGARPGRVVAFRVVGSRWRQVPVQVDERAKVDLGRVYGQAPNGVAVLTYTDAGTFTGADADARLDANDEIALMASDSGARARRGQVPRGVVAATGTELRVRDPLSGQTGYAYLFRAWDPALRPGAGRAYVRYRFGLKSGSYRTSYGLQSGPNPEDSTIATAFYARHFSDRWIGDGLRIIAGRATGVDILDRHTVQFGPGACGRSEDTFSAGEGAFIVNRSGPVRAIRSYVGANSGPLTEREHVFYARREDIHTYLRVHAIPGVMDLFDYSTAATGMTYRNQLAKGGVKIDGQPDSVPQGTLRWEQVTGKQGTLTISHSFATDVPGLAPTSFQLDRAAPQNQQERLCTSDRIAFGASGPWVRQSIPSTDPAQGAANHLTTTRVLYFDPAGAGASEAARRDAQARRPLAVRASPTR